MAFRTSTQSDRRATDEFDNLRMLIESLALASGDFGVAMNRLRNAQRRNWGGALRVALAVRLLVTGVGPAAQEEHKTLRTWAICGTIVAGMAIISYAAVQRHREIFEESNL